MPVWGMWTDICTNLSSLQYPCHLLLLQSHTPMSSFHPTLPCHIPTSPVLHSTCVHTHRWFIVEETGLLALIQSQPSLLQNCSAFQSHLPWLSERHPIPITVKCPPPSVPAGRENREHSTDLINNQQNMVKVYTHAQKNKQKKENKDCVSVTQK